MTSPLEQKIKITGPVVVTANRVGDGAVVYRRADGGWTTVSARPRSRPTVPPTRRELIDAAVADDLRAVGPYIAPVKLDRRRRSAAGKSARAHSACAVRPSICRPRGRSSISESSRANIKRAPCTSTTISTARWSPSALREFRDQVARRLSGELTEDEFKPLRLMNGVYLQLHAYMLRTAIPYGTLSSEQMRMLAHVARRFDRGYGHFTTRQNIQYHWIKLDELPDAMADLASVGMHGMQTSGNCVRNITTDQWAGVAPDEIEDPRVWAEMVRQHVDTASRIHLPAAQVQDRGRRVAL